MARLQNFKVTSTEEKHGRHYTASSFDKFSLVSLRGDLSNLSAMLGGDAFTEVYFKTESGNIYKFFREKDEYGHPTKWALVKKDNLNTKYYPTDAEMYYGFLQLQEQFYYGTGGYSSKVVEIICVNSSRVYGDIASRPEATLVQLFNTALKGKLAVDAITKKM